MVSAIRNYKALGADKIVSESGRARERESGIEWNRERKRGIRRKREERERNRERERE